MIPQWKEANLYYQLYIKQPTYGADGARHASLMTGLIRSFGVKSVLDFGCGPNQTLLKALTGRCRGVAFFGYDPAVIYPVGLCTNTWDTSHVDMVISTDCFEHIPEDELDQCFSLILGKTPKIVFFVICTRSAVAVLPDGTNAHKTVKPGSWWVKKIQSYLRSYTIKQTNEFYETYVRPEAHIFGMLSPTALEGNSPAMGA